MNFTKDNKVTSWQSFCVSPFFYAWRGNAFEIVCLNHISQIKTALGISGIESAEYSWKSRKKQDGAQTDLLIDRRDDVINVCEMKCTDRDFVIDKKYREELINKTEIFREETKSHKSIHLTMITSKSLKRNENTEIINNVIEGDRLFT